MAVKYTFDEFKKAAEKEGLLGEFSEADLKLAQADPNAGMSILTYKLDYKNATTPEAKALANRGAEDVRRAAGYVGGTSGSSFKTYDPTPGSFSYAPAPTYKNTLAGELQKRRAAVLNRQPFSYDPEADKLYQTYKNAYMREGKAASDQVLAQIAARTGGMASSYAGNAAAQTFGQYAAKAADKVPELEAAAFNRYLSENQLAKDDLAILQAEEQQNYGRHLDERNQYNADRALAYQQQADELALRENRAALERSLAENEYQKALTEAQLAASVGDFSKLRALGIEPSPETLAKFNAANGKKVYKTPDDTEMIKSIKDIYGSDISEEDWETAKKTFGVNDDWLNKNGFKKKQKDDGGGDIPEDAPTTNKIIVRKDHNRKNPKKYIQIGNRYYLWDNIIDAENKGEIRPIYDKKTNTVTYVLVER